MKTLRIIRISLWLLVFPLWISTFYETDNDMLFWLLLLLTITFHCFEHGFSDYSICIMQSDLPNIKSRITSGIKNIFIGFGVILFWVLFAIFSYRMNFIDKNCRWLYAGYDTGWSSICVSYER